MSSYIISKSSIKMYQSSELYDGKKKTSKQRTQDYNYNTVCIFIKVKITTIYYDSVYFTIQMKQILDGVFNTILQGVLKRWPELIKDINELKKVPGNLPLNIFPCYRQTLDHIIKNCFSLPKVK